MVKPAARRIVAGYLQQTWKVSQRRACRLVRLSRSVNRYKPKPDQNGKLRAALKRLAEKYPRLGFPMLFMMLRNEGWKVNHKRVERLYRLEKLALRRRKKTRKFRLIRTEVKRATKPMERLAIDFMSDALVTGRKLRLLTVVDEASKESPAIEVEHSMSGEFVVKVLNQIATTRGLPASIRLDNGPELRSKALLSWATQNNVELCYITPGKPTENAYIESFNGRVREECLDQELFLSLDDAKQKVEQWRQFYNNLRPHSALGGQPPGSFPKTDLYEIKETGT